MGTHYDGTPEERRAVDTYIKLQRASDSIAAHATRHLAQDGLTFSQYGVLDSLFHLGPLSQGQIAEKILKSGGNITTVVDNLERQGLVKRERETRDRRVVTVSLTEKGRELIMKVLPQHIQAIVEAMSVLTPVEQQVLGRLCRRLGKREEATTVDDLALEMEEKAG